MPRKQLLLIFGFVFLDLLGYSLILPLLPYYAEAFGATITIVGLLGTSNAIGQLIAAPIIGRLSDRYGRRPLLIFSVIGTLLSFLLLGLANSLTLVFLSRILDGLLGGNIALARSYITDITDEKNRGRGLGMIGAAFGLGFIIGPAMGGLLSRYGFGVPALVASGLSLLNLVAILLWLPESTSPEQRAALKASPQTRFTLGALMEALQRPCTGPLLYTQLLYSLAFTLFQSTFALYAKTHLDLSAQTTSYVLTYVGMLSVLVQGVAIGRLIKRYSERPLMGVSIAALAVSLLSWGLVPNLGLLLVVLAPIALSAGILGVVVSSQLTKSVLREEVGGTLGLSASMQTVAQIVMPSVGSFLLASLGAWSVGALGALLMLVAFVFARLRVFAVPEAEMVSCISPAFSDVRAKP